MRSQLPPIDSTNNVYWYPYTTNHLFPILYKITNRVDAIDNWYVWRHQTVETVWQYNLVVGDRYVKVPKADLVNQITTSFRNSYINIIFSYMRWRMYMSMQSGDALKHLVKTVPDVTTVLQKYKVTIDQCDWGLYLA